MNDSLSVVQISYSPSFTNLEILYENKESFMQHIYLAGARIGNIENESTLTSSSLLSSSSHSRWTPGSDYSKGLQSVESLNGFQRALDSWHAEKLLFLSNIDDNDSPTYSESENSTTDPHESPKTHQTEMLSQYTSPIHEIQTSQQNLQHSPHPADTEGPIIRNGSLLQNYINGLSNEKLITSPHQVPIQTPTPALSPITPNATPTAQSISPSGTLAKWLETNCQSPDPPAKDSLYPSSLPNLSNIQPYLSDQSPIDTYNSPLYQNNSNDPPVVLAKCVRYITPMKLMEWGKASPSTQKSPFIPISSNSTLPINQNPYPCNESVNYPTDWTSPSFNIQYNSQRPSRYSDHQVRHTYTSKS
eukprot:NODE_2947_length_1454_cov_47.747558_g2553_i0.p1 GENE.NODE_2947_length_1454_cov_47.747558_g2553_i0~~NODE_2947_length_1454_cov_47.747558_g2553_i0.p1  ORF type:complete len:377 (+),score=83.27 NODE_2947_length_1454_cov_47.747558_g2553_i0:53-1132(+)